MQYYIKYGTGTSASASTYCDEDYGWSTWPSTTSAASDSYTINNSVDKLYKSLKWGYKDNGWYLDNGTTTSNIYYDYEDCTTQGSGWVQLAQGRGWAQLAPRPLLDPQARLREIMAARQGPAIHVRPTKYYNPADERELRARETLRRVIGDQNYRYFLRTGFINVRGKSGILYRICKGHMVDAYKGGKLVERLCVYLKGDFPPADELITKFLMILNNEEQFRALSNISRGYGSARHLTVQPKPDTRPLPEILRELKAA
jgi:hypothetical protein